MRGRPKKMNKPVKINLLIDETQYLELKRIAEQNHTTMTDLLRFYITELINQSKK